MNTWTRKSQSVSSCWALNFSNFQFWLMLQGETCKIITLYFKYTTKTAEGKYVLFSDKNLKNKKMLCRMFSYISEGLIFMYMYWYLFVIVFHISGCCIYEKPKMFDESSSDDSDDECRSCRGHKDKCFRTDKDDNSGMWYYTIQSKQHFFLV